MENRNNRGAFVCNGASNHSVTGERQPQDYYATEPKALTKFLEKFREDGEEISPTVWECACGGGHLVDALHNMGYGVFYTDIVDYGYPDTILHDFFGELPFDSPDKKVNMDIITNPPYSMAKEFIEKALDVVSDNQKVIMLLKLTFLESKKRRELFEKYPPKYIYVSSSRLQCAKNGDFETYKNGTGTAIAYAWFVWEKGYKGEPVVRWFN